MVVLQILVVLGLRLVVLQVLVMLLLSLVVLQMVMITRSFVDGLRFDDVRFMALGDTIVSFRMLSTNVSRVE